MDQGLIILNIGYSLTFVALAIREILWLRLTLTASQAFLFIYHFLISENTTAVFWTAVFMIVNIYMIIKIFNERRIRIIPDELIDLYDGIFHQLTSNEFLYFWNMGTIKSTNDDFFDPFWSDAGKSPDGVEWGCSCRSQSKKNSQP